jgi:hypothetical protein
LDDARHRNSSVRRGSGHQGGFELAWQRAAASGEDRQAGFGRLELDSTLLTMISEGRPQLLFSLKTLLESGEPLAGE